MSESLLMDKKLLTEYLYILEKKKQLIFYGPPGTGKTYVAQEIAEYVARCKGKKQVLKILRNFSK